MKENKPWYKSKTLWSVVIQISIVLLKYFKGDFPGEDLLQIAVLAGLVSGTVSKNRAPLSFKKEKGL